MSDSAAASDLSTCGCCEGVRDRVPARIANRPGLSEIAYRVGAYSQFKQSLLAGLTDAARPKLGKLLTRESDDFAIALIDAWAMVGDVLSFYVERTAQEHYLATATERRSVAALVHLIGYRPHAGVAASTVLAFTLEASPLPPRQAPPGAPERAPIALGTRVQSIPGPDERPQTFETIEDLEALVAWNRLTPRLTAPRYPRDGDEDLYLAGAALNLNPGDLLLFVGDWQAAAPNTGWDLQRVIRVEPDARANRTHVFWESALSTLAATAVPPAAQTPVQVFVLRQRASLFGYNAPDPRLFTKEVRDKIKGDLLCKTTGGTAPCKDQTNADDAIDWDFVPLAPGAVDLDALVQGLKPGGWAVLTNPTIALPALAVITGVHERSRSSFAISARVTSLAVNRTDANFPVFGDQKTRGTAVLLGSEELALAETPIAEPVSGAQIACTVDQAIAPLAQPRTIVVRGRRQRVLVPAGLPTALTLTAATGTTRLLAADDVLVAHCRESGPTGVAGTERWRLETSDGFIGKAEIPVATLRYVPAAPSDPLVAEVAFVTLVADDPTSRVTTLTLADPLANLYDPPTVEIFGNVAAATHGESIRNEILGNGDAARPYQQFALDKGPLTHTSAPTPSGGVSTLKVWVNDVRWDEAATFFGASPRDRLYVTDVSETGETAVRFGDGVNGARPATGHENIRATYRVGIGGDGNLGPERLTLLMTRPLGVKGVTNPLPASGGQEPQTADDARAGAPLTVLTLDRIVSLQDYEDFARAFAGVTKAAAVATWDGERYGILLTVAGIDGTALVPGVFTYDNLVAAIAQAGNPRLAVQVKTFLPVTFGVSASLLIDSQYEPEAVLASARAELTARFAFPARAFGQQVSLSEVTAGLQHVSGVVAVDVDQLYRTGDAPLLNPYLIAAAPASGAPPSADAAELLTLDPGLLTIAEMQR